MSSSFADVFESATLEALSEALAPPAVSTPEPVPPPTDPGDLLSSNSRDVRRALACSPEPQLVLEAWRKHLKLVLLGSGSQQAERLFCLKILSSEVPQPADRFLELVAFSYKNVDVLCPDTLFSAATTLLDAMGEDMHQQAITTAVVELFSHTASEPVELVFGNLLLPIMDHPNVDVSAILLALTPRRARRLADLAREEYGFKSRHLSSLTVSGVLAAHLFDSCAWLSPYWEFSGSSSDAFGTIVLDESCAPWVSAHPRQFARLLEAKVNLGEKLVEALADTAPPAVLRLMLCSSLWDFCEIDEDFLGLSFRFAAGIARRLELNSCRFRSGSTTVTLMLKPSSDASNEAKASKLKLPTDVFAALLETSAFTDSNFRWEPPPSSHGTRPVMAAVTERHQLVEAFTALVTAAWPWISADGVSDEFDATFRWLCTRTHDDDQALASWLPQFVASVSDDLWSSVTNALKVMEVLPLMAAILVELPPDRFAQAWHPTKFSYTVADMVPHLLKVLPPMSPDMAPVFVGLLPGWEGTLRELAESVSALSA